MGAGNILSVGAANGCTREADHYLDHTDPISTVMDMFSTLFLITQIPIGKRVTDRRAYRFMSTGGS